MLRFNDSSTDILNILNYLDLSKKVTQAKSIKQDLSDKGSFQII